MILTVIGDVRSQPPPARGLRLEPSRITLNVDAVPLRKVLEAFHRQSGNAPIVPRPDWKKPVSIDVRNLPYWQALDQLCAQEGLVYECNSQTGVVELHPGKGLVEVKAYAGPMVLRITGARKERPYWERRGRGGSYLIYQLAWFWEDRLPVTSMELSLTRATAGDDTEIELPRRLNLMHTTSLSRFLGAKVKAGWTAQMQLKVPPNLAGQLSDLVFEMDLTAAAGKKEVLVRNMSRGDKSATKDGLTLEVHKSGLAEGRAYVSALTFLNGQKLVPREHKLSTEYGFWLVGANGKKYPGRVVIGKGIRLGYAGGSVSIPEGHLAVRFRGTRVRGQEWSLLFACPTQAVSTKLKFHLKDVPLP